MRKTTGSRIIKLLSLAAVLVLMLALCGCRTRITNNNEVPDVMYDEEGYMQTEYDMRRDELSLSTAPKPLFTGFGRASDEEEDYDDEDMSAFDDYDPNAPDEEYGMEPEEEVTGSGGGGGEGTSEKGTQSRVVNRKLSKKKTANNGELTVRLKLNGGKCEVSSIKVKKGEKYSALPEKVTKEGYIFAGWHSKDNKDPNTLVTSDTVVTASSNHFLYAQWDPVTTPEEEVLYTVTYTDGVEGETVFEDKVSSNHKAGEKTPSFGDKEPVREGYSFIGWTPELRNVIDAGQADSNHNIIYTATWENLHDVWQKTFDDTKKGLDQIGYVIYPDASNKDLVDSCNGNIESENIEIAVIFTDDIKHPENIIIPDEAAAIRKIIAVSNDAVKSSDKNEQLYLKLLLLSSMYDLDIGDAKAELGITEEDKNIVLILKAE